MGKSLCVERPPRDLDCKRSGIRESTIEGGSSERHARPIVVKGTLWQKRGGGWSKDLRTYTYNLRGGCCRGVEVGGSVLFVSCSVSCGWGSH